MMAISYLQEFEKLVLIDWKSEQQNLHTVNKLLHTLHKELVNVEQTIVEIGVHIQAIPEIIKQINEVVRHKVELSSPHESYGLQVFYAFLEERDLSYDDIELGPKNIIYLFEKLSAFSVLEIELLQAIKKEGYIEEYNKIKKLRTLALTKKPFHSFVRLYQQVEKMQELFEDLEREKRKTEVKLQKKDQKFLVEELRESREFYRKDTIMLIEGLLQTDGDYFQMLRTQLDDQYRQMIQSKLIQINKLVNLQEKTFIDDKRVYEMIEDFKKTNKKLFRFL